MLLVQLQLCSPACGKQQVKTVPPGKNYPGGAFRRPRIVELRVLGTDKTRVRFSGAALMKDRLEHPWFLLGGIVAGLMVGVGVAFAIAKKK